MTFIEILLRPVFEILNFNVKIPIDFNNHFIEFRLYYIAILLFIVEMLVIVWVAMMDNGSGLYNFDETIKEDRIDTETGEYKETIIKRKGQRRRS